MKVLVRRAAESVASVGYGRKHRIKVTSCSILLLLILIDLPSQLRFTRFLNLAGGPLGEQGKDCWCARANGLAHVLDDRSQRRG